MKRHVVNDQEIMRFNQARENYKGKEMNREELLQALKSLNYPASSSMISKMVRGVNPPIVRISRGKYAFSSTPVYKGRLQTVFSGNNKKNTEQAQQCKIEIAIQLLKQNGYKILKPKPTEYEEV